MIYFTTSRFYLDNGKPEKFQHYVSRLFQTIRHEHADNIEECFLWSDSITIIKWLRSYFRNPKVIANCQVFSIRKTVPITPLMEPFPADRVTPYVRPLL
ncbi:unnamed protein product [Ceratitis capitata]|uniref:(Mediterranean fruit fly) hypothetical protein n=1 Tax=Ceratitis capitata TaxID=7213 RepID=A0A811UPN3_CERCA|nr:unnamed protein product [Ceratitis capitata]